MPVIAVIPARYGSTRLPAKALADIDGVPMVVRVWRQVSMARSIERVIVATDDERIAAPVRAAGGEAMMTSAAHQSGTDRIAEVAGKVHADIYINVQGDQPFTDPRDLDAVAAPMLNDASIDMATLATPITDLEEFRNPTKVKVVCDGVRQRALFFAQPDSAWARYRGRAGRCAAPHRDLCVSARLPAQVRIDRAGKTGAAGKVGTATRARKRLSHQGGRFRGAVA